MAKRKLSEAVKRMNQSLKFGLGQAPLFSLGGNGVNNLKINNLSLSKTNNSILLVWND